MSKYLIEFSKEGYIKYTSHLDMIRLFKRGFKRTGIKPEYSFGFNPHPKMSFAQPLSLGYTGLNEILEIDTKEDFLPEEITERLREAMPPGIKILNTKKVQAGGKTMASLVTAAEFEITIPAPNDNDMKYDDIIDRFMAQKEIFAEKRQKKTGQIKEIDIKPMIFHLSADVIDDNIIMTTKLAQGSNINLSPELLIDSFLKFTNNCCDRSEIEVTRKRIIF